MATEPLIITNTPSNIFGDEQEAALIYTPVLRHLALEGDAKTPVYMITKDEEGKDVKTLIATLSAACPQHACEIPCVEAMFCCEGSCKVHAIFTVDLEEGDEYEDMDDMEMEGMEDMEGEEFEDEEEDFKEIPVETKKIMPVEEKKPVAPKKEEKKVEKKEVKKEAKEMPAEQSKKDKKKNKKNKKNGKK